MNSLRKAAWVAACTMIGLSAALITPVRAADPTPAPASTAPDKQQGSYLLGLQFAQQLAKAGVLPSLSLDALQRGVHDGFAGKTLQGADEASIQAFVAAGLQAALDRNVAAATAFLAKHATEPGVTTTPSGLQYRVLATGDSRGEPPTARDVTVVQYRGSLLDGTEFDSSYARHEPATFHLNVVIKGWQEALAMMKPGDRWQIWVPPALAYDKAAKPGIPAGSLLIFELELVSVQKTEKF